MGQMNTTAVGLGLAAMQGVANYKTASAQYKINEANRVTNNQRALEALTTSYRALNEESEQIKENALSVAIESQRAAAVAKGEVKAKAGASGMGGTGADKATDDINIEAGRNAAKSTMMKERQLNQVEAKRDASYKTFQSRLDLMPNQKPSKGAFALQAGATGFRNVVSLNSLSSAATQAGRAGTGSNSPVNQDLNMNPFDRLA